MLELNNIYNCDCREGLKQLDDNSVDLTVTSPPYDSLRTYQDDEFAWNFDIFKEVADELYRVTKPGGIIVWVVGDEVVNGGETGTSFRQALYFQEIGFKIHDTMIYEKNSSTFPAKKTSKRYSQIFEYMFIFVKGKKIRDDIKLIADKKNKWAGWTNWGTKSQYDKEGNLIPNMKSIKPTPEYSLRNNIWKYNVSFNDKTGHPAVFPEKLAEDHILSWSNEGDVVLDPFMGSGTTAKMAMLNKRNYIGFEKSEDYYKKSLERVGKYEGKVNDTLGEMTREMGEEGEETFIVSTDNDKEEAEKIAIINGLIEQLNEYYATMSSSILKTLKLTFVSKANDRRVVSVLKERGLYTGETESTEVVVQKEQYVPPTMEVINVEAQKINTQDEIDEEPAEKKAKVNLGPTRLVINPSEEQILDCIKKELSGGGMILNVIREEIRRNDVLNSTKLGDEVFLMHEEMAEKYIPENKPFDPIEKIAEEIICEKHTEPVAEEPKKRGRGRPKGSKNKPKNTV